MAALVWPLASDIGDTPENLFYQSGDVFAVRPYALSTYLILAALCGLAAALSSNVGLLVATVLLIVIGGYHFLAAWPLTINQTEALTVASRTVGFPVGHASGQLGFRGLRSRPSWRILLYSADEPPSLRGLVELDGVDGAVQGEYTEINHEDWYEYGLDATSG